MSNELTQDITDAINKNLSAQVAAVLKARLESVDVLEAKAREQEAKITELRTRIDAQNRELVAANDRINGYVAREGEFKKSEAAVAAAMLGKAVSDAKLDGAMEVTRLAFGNNVIRRTLQAYGSAPVVNNGYTSSGITNNNETVTTEG